MSSNSQPQTPSSQARSKTGRFLTVPKVEPSPFEAPPSLAEPIRKASDGGEVEIGDDEARENKKAESFDADCCAGEDRPRQSVDTERFLDAMRKLENGASSDAASSKREEQKGNAGVIPKPKAVHVVAKNTQGMDFFDQLDAMEGGYFPPV